MNTRFTERDMGGENPARKEKEKKWRRGKKMNTPHLGGGGGKRKGENRVGCGGGGTERPQLRHRGPRLWHH